MNVRSLVDDNDRVFLPGIFDTENYYWGEEIFNFTVSLINNHSDGFFDDVFNDGTVLDFAVEDGGCDRTIAMRAYWDVRSQNGEKAPHGIIGTRCSSASVAVASIASLEAVPQVSFSATSMHLSDTEEFPFFSRVVDAKEAFALKALYRSMGWHRVLVLHTDTQWARDLVTTFQSIWVGPHRDASGDWTGEVFNLPTVTLNDDGTANTNSIRQALKGAPLDDPTVNSRVILLAAHDQHVYPIWKGARALGFPSDTIWTGVDATTWFNASDLSSPLNSNAGSFLGIVPFSSTQGTAYQDYLGRLQQWQLAQGKLPWSHLPEHYSFYEVDAILSLAMALSNTTKGQRRNGTAVTEALHNVTFSGVSGEVSFTETGDRSDPLYSIFHIKAKQWQNFGFTGTAVGQTDIATSQLCFKGFPCGVIPEDTFPVPEPDNAMGVGLIVLISFFCVAVVVLVGLYVRLKRKKNKYKNILAQTKQIDTDLSGLAQQVEAAKQKQAQLILERAQLQGTPSTWTHTGELVVEVQPEEPEYWDVFERMRETIGDVHISKLWRIENTPLWSYYSFHKDRILKQTAANSNIVSERQVWHGTSGLDPSVIYEDEQDGFMMQFAAKGYWGRGIYFAQNASYSHHYAHKPSSSASFQSQRGQAQEEEREMFLTKLLVGAEVQLERDSTLIAPPPNPQTGNKYRYHSVTGNTGGSQVWIVYENGRAYPEYLVRYYQGQRDRGRSPYGSRQESLSKKRSSKKLAKSLDEAESGGTDASTLDGSSGGSAGAVWEFKENNGGWVAFEAQHQAMLEGRYADLKNSTTTDPKVLVQTNQWRYEVDVNSLQQTNLDHGSHRVRDIRRRPLNKGSLVTFVSL